MTSPVKRPYLLLRSTSRDFGRDWVCPQCGDSNESFTLVCGTCEYPEKVITGDERFVVEGQQETQQETQLPLTPRMNAASEKPGTGRWTCMVCSFPNKETTTNCVVCDCERPSDIVVESSRTKMSRLRQLVCPVCDHPIELNQSSTACTNCDYSEVVKVSPEDEVALQNATASYEAGKGDVLLVVSSRLGATVQKGDLSGVYFRVWAPRATSVSVSGTFNNWSNIADQLLPEPGDNGYFSGIVSSAKAGDHYNYIIKKPNGGRVWRSDPRSPVLIRGKKYVHSLIYDMEAFKWEDADFKPPTLDKLVIYEMYIPAFGAKENDLDGTFLTCIERLDHLVALGINCIEVMPISQDHHHCCWGYDPVSLFAIQSEMGTPDDLKQFINEAHKRGLSVILDWVPNHMSMNNILHEFDDDSDGGCYIYPDPRRRDTDYGPRINFSSEGVRKWVKDSLILFLFDFHFDGVRVDSTNTMRKTGNEDLIESWTLLQECTDLVRKRDPNKILIAEDLQSNDMINYVTGFHSQWDPSFFSVLYHNSICLSDAQRNMDQIAEVIRNSFLGAGISRVTYTENHDTIPEERQSRLPKAICPQEADKNYYAIKRSLLAATVMLTAPGIPMLCQGQEFLELSSANWPTGPLMKWSNATSNSEVLKAYTKLCNLRSGRYPLAPRGLQGPFVKTYHVNNIAKVIAYHRFEYGGAGDDVIVIVNFSNRYFKQYKLGFPRPGQWEVLFNTDQYTGETKDKPVEKIETYTGWYDGYFFHGLVPLGRYSTLILSQIRK